MRDIAVTLAVVIGLVLVLRQPYMGIIVSSWLGYMSPHRLAYGFAYEAPFAQIVAIVTMLSILISKEQKKIQWSAEATLLLIFVIWMLITTFFAEYQDLAWMKWDKVWKIQLFMLLTVLLINSKERLNMLVWVIVLSLGFYGVKGGIFTINTGGSHLVLGPTGSFIQNRGDLGTALNMTIPLMRYLQLQTANKWVRLGLTAAMVLTCFAIIGTHSRGAFLGLIVVLFFLIMKSRRKIVLTIFLAATAYSILSFMPAEWGMRIDTIQSYEQDGSAMGRIEAWKDTIYYAKQNPIMGGGFDRNPGGRAAHNIFIQVLGDHGYVGLVMFACLGLMTWVSAGRIRKRVKDKPDMKWMGDLMAMAQVCLAGYGSGGFFLSLAYFDLTYHLMIFVVICKVLLAQHDREKGLEEPVRKKVDRQGPQWSSPGS